MPMGKIVRLSSSYSLPMGVGCMNNLYRSVHDIDEQILLTEECCAMLLCPHNAAESFLSWLKLNLMIVRPHFNSSIIHVASSVRKVLVIMQVLVVAIVVI